MPDEIFMLKTGALPSPIDPRDWTLASVGAPTTYGQQSYIDTSWMKVSMQGHIGCCVGCTFEEIIRIMVHNATGLPVEELSWRFVYAVCKALDGAPGEGTYPSLAAKVIRTYGVPLAKYCPNDVSLDHETFVFNRTLTNIPQAAFADALTRKGGADMAVPVSIDGIKQAINYAKSNKGGVAILRQVDKAYWTDANGANTWQRSKLFPMRTPNPPTSGHEELLYGYLDIFLAERQQLESHQITIDQLIAKYPEGTPASAARTETVILWLNHWSDSWGSTSGNQYGTDAASHDGGRGYEFADVWLRYIVEIRCSVPVVQVVDGFTYTFTKHLSQGMQGADVVALQHALKLEGCVPATLPFTGYFGTATLAAVKAFQLKYANDCLKPAGLTMPTGYVGDLTLAKLNALYSHHA